MFSDLWSKAASDSFCPNHDGGRHAHTQKDCQDLCEAKSESECVGISYSSYIGKANFCVLCMDDTLISANNEYDFYRRPGIFRIFCGLLTETCPLYITPQSNNPLYPSIFFR